MKEQEDDIASKCGSLIAAKLKELMSLGKEGLKKEDMPQVSQDTSLMKRVGKLWEDPTSQSNLLSPGSKGKSSVVTDSLTPKVIKVDADGRALTAHETVVAAGTQERVDTIPWREWASNVCALDTSQVAKQVLGLAMAANHNHVTCNIPIAMVRSGSVVKALATTDIPIGHLKVPLWFKKDTSMVMEGSSTTIHPKAVCSEVSWVKALTPLEKDAGVECGEQVVARIHVQPELKLPKEGDAGFVWDPRDAVHPFWFMRRSETVQSQTGSQIVANASMVMETVTYVCATDYVQLKTAKAEVDALVSTYSVKLPFIVNTAPIKAGDEAIVKWESAPTVKKQKAATQQTAFDQIAGAQKKARRENR